jgi:hypothetical protein
MQTPVQNKTRKPVRGLQGTGCVAFIALCAVWSCGSSDSYPVVVPAGDAGPEPLKDGATGVICPKTMIPKTGAVCTLPEGTTCTVGICADTLAQCSSGKWRVSATPALPFKCPSQVPQAGSECSVCFPRDRTCSYGCEDAGASMMGIVASCIQGTWRAEANSCTNAPVDASPE